MGPKPKVLLIGWDAADWEHITPLMDQGLLPALSSLVNRGVMGNLGTLHPVLSPMLWNTIATGKHAHKHGIYGFVEPDPVHGGARPYSSVSRKTKALWNILSQNGYRSNMTNWWASHPAEPVNGCIVSNSFHSTRPDKSGRLIVPAGTIHPADRTESLAPNKLFSHELTGDQILPFVPRGKELNQNEDHRLAVLADNLSEMLTTHNVATAVMENEPWDFMAVYYTAIDHFAHSFMSFHPPKLPWVSDADYEMFKDVMTSVYRFSDMTLHRLLQLAGPDTTVILCSDHGFQSKNNRPHFVPNEPTAPAYWHRQFGIFVAAGPGIKKDERVYGASLLDIAPTILSVYGLPIGKDFDGRPLTEIFESPVTPKYIPSWDDVPGDSGMHTGEPVNVSKEDNDEVLRQLIALGYVDAPGGDKEQQRIYADTECRFNLACNLGWCGELSRAIPILVDLVNQHPWENRFIDELLHYLRLAGNVPMAEKLILATYDLRTTHNLSAILAWIDILITKNESEKASSLLSALLPRVEGSADILSKIGYNFLRLRQLRSAEHAFSLATKAHPDHAEAWQGLSSVLCRQGRNQETADAALNAIRLIYRLPKAHLNLGIALARAKQYPQAITALETALKFNPNIRRAHRWLALIYESLPNQAAKVGHHVGELHRIHAQSSAPRESNPISSQIFPLPTFPSESERARIINQKRPTPASISERSGKSFVLVSGLPRSGTSLMMQMLEAGGLPPKTDGERTADGDNPRGYYEWEAIKQVASNPQLLDEPGLEQKAIKAIAALLPQLPYRHEYKVLFMTRPIEEVIRSQSEMIANRGTDSGKLSQDQMARQMKSHRDEVLDWLRNHPRAQLLEVDYPSLVKSPDEWIPRISAFLGSDTLPNPTAMRNAIDGNLYRKRASN